MRHTLRLGLAAVLAFFNLAIALPALAQMPNPDLPPVHSMVDERGVDLTSGDVRITDSAKLSMGTPDNGISHVRTWSGYNGWRHNNLVVANASGGHVDIIIGDDRQGFTLSGGMYSPDQANGATLTENSTSYVFNAEDGTRVDFQKISSDTSYEGSASAVATAITKPSGMATHFHYRTENYQTEFQGSYTTLKVMRLQSIRTSTGFQIKYMYKRDAPPTVISILGGTGWDTLIDWMTMSYVAAINAANDYCDPQADTCGSLTQIWPTIGYAVSASGSARVESVTDPAGRTSKYFSNGGLLTAIRKPSSPDANTTEYVYDGNGNVASAAVAGVGSWGYNFSASGGTLTATINTPTLPTWAPRTVVSRTDLASPTSDTDENGQTISYSYCSGTAGCPNGLLDTVTQPQGNSVTYRYDSRGNVTSTVWTPKPGSGLATLTTSATFASSCSNAATCNKPITTTDTAGQVTDYSYNANGTLDWVKLPSPGGSAPRPETHYTYWNGQAWLKWSSNSVTLAPDVVTYPWMTITCITGSWPCAASDQRQVELGYVGGPSATNVLVNAVTVRRGDNSQSTTTSWAYDAVGNKVSVTDPLGAQTTMAYAADRQLTGVRSPSPDGTSTGPRRALVYHYDGNGQVDSIGVGPVNWDGTGFSPVQYTFPSYDVAGRKVAERVTDGAATTTYSLRQWSYSGRGLLECETIRMNPAAFNSAPGACTLGTSGAYGPDRITHYIWEFAGALDRIQSGYGTAQQRDEVHYTRTANGKLREMFDAKGNVTTYAYDGHDRQLRECYNTAASTCEAGTASDFVQLTYDSVGRLTNRSLRGHPTWINIGYVYDNLGRVTNANYPGGSLYDAPVAFTYDNLGQLLTAIDTNTHTASFSYDALGRVVSQGSARSSATMQYDAAGQRTRLTWGDGRYVTYEYNGTGDMTAIRENGSSLLASFGYDGIGRRTSLTRGNGVTTYYDYDAISRLACLRNDLAGGSTLACSSSSVTASGQDQATNFAYNPASQIVSRSAANDAYAWQGHYNFNRNYTANGLNQYTAVGSLAPTYDVKGHLASTGAGETFYTSTKGEMIYRGDTGIGFYHDPLGRLDSVLSGASYGFEYVDGQITDEFSGSSGNPTLRRYVYGPNVDEPLVWYEGSDFSDKRYLVADERGSIAAVTNSSGVATSINSYDEYGIPRSSNAGRFQYTGQAWLSELGMYSYKARVYSPTLGRFAQTDPAGYPDGPNWYNYVNADPVNKTDPTGLAGECEDIGVCSSTPPITVIGYRSPVNVDYLPNFTFPGLSGSSPFAPGFTDYLGAVQNDSPPRPKPPVGRRQNNNGPCTGNKSIFASIAEGADTVGDVADGVAIGAAGLGLITAPTGAGGAFFGGTALIAGGVGRLASGVSVLANLADGNWGGAGSSAAGIVGGHIAGKVVGRVATSAYARGRMFNNLSAGQQRRVDLFSDTGASAGSRVASRAVCP